LNMHTKSTAVAMGLFDGVHLGHRKVLEMAYHQKENGLIPSAFTFRAEMAKQKQAEWIYSTNTKIWMLENDCGMERILAPPFETICEMSGEEFVQRILCEQLHASYLCCGHDFRFGKNAGWNVNDLQEFSKIYGFTLEIVEDVKIDSVTVSSTEIRKLLKEGNLEKANILLGEPYLILQEVTHGAQLGRTIDFPTINQIFGEGQLIPAYGVYASSTRTPKGWFPSITNIGRKPTVNYCGMPLAETYIDGFSGDLYGQRLQVVLWHFLRPEQKFSSVEALTQQMHQDLNACRQISKSFHHSDT